MCHSRLCGWVLFSSLMFSPLMFSSLMAVEAQVPSPPASTPSQTTTQASTATASFAYVTDEGCVQNEVMVFVNRTTVSPGKARAAKAPTAIAEVSYSRHRYNDCEDTELGTDLGTNSRPAFSGDLNRAALNVTINGHTESGDAVPVSFVLVWEGRGNVTRRAGTPQNPGSSRVIQSEDLSRNAVVSGTLDDEDISAASIGASLHTTRKTIAAKPHASSN